MSVKNSPASRELINRVLNPHTELALDLFSLVRSRSTGDPTYRFQIAGLIVFLSGVDKALSLALQLGYLANRVEWEWLTAKRTLEPGVIECYRGLTAKLQKLESLGLDLKKLQWIVDLRNDYIHSCQILAGYHGDLDEGDEPRYILKASGPRIEFSGHPPLVAIGPVEIQTYAGQLTERLGEFLDAIGWQVAWESIAEKLSHLPINPEPEYFKALKGSVEEIYSLILSLNERYVGDGLRLLRDQKQENKS